MANALTGVFVADFSKFQDAVAQAQVTLRSFDTGSQQVEKSLNRVANSFSGRTIIQQAELASRAIQEIGGMSLLTAQEQAKANALFDEARSKIAALGTTATPAMQGLAKDLENIQQKSFDATSALDHLKKGIEDPFGALKEGAVGFLEAIGPMGAVLGVAGAAMAAWVTEAHALAKEAGAIGGQLNDMSEKTGIAVGPLSNLSAAAQIAGSNLDTVSNAIFLMQRNLVEGSAKFEAGMQRLGIVVADFKKLSPDQQFLEIADAIKQIASPADRAAVAMEVFGRSGRDLLPVLMKDLHGLVQESEDLGFTWSEKDAKAAEDFEMASRKLDLALQNVRTTIGRELVPAFTEALTFARGSVGWILTSSVIQDMLSDLALVNAALSKTEAPLPTVKSPAGFGDSTSGFKAGTEAMQQQAQAAGLLQSHLDKLREASAPLTAVQQAQAAAMLAGGDSADTIARYLDVATVSVKNFEEAQKKANEELKKLAEADYQATYQSVGLGIFETGGRLKFLNDSLALTQNTFGRFGQNVGLITPRFSDLHDQLVGVDHATGNLHATMIDSATATLSFADQEKYVTEQTALMRAELERINALDFGKTFGESLAKIPDVLIKAFEGGGGIAGAAKAIGVMLANDLLGPIMDALSKAGKQALGLGSALAAGIGGAVGGSAGAAVGSLSASFGGLAVAAVAAHAGIALSAVALGAWTAGIGAAAVGVFELAKHFLTVSQAEKDARQAFDDFNKAIGGSNMQDLINRVSAAGAVMGINGEQVRQMLVRLEEATHVSPQAVAAALKPLADLIDEADKKTAAFSDGLKRLQSDAGGAFNAMAIALEGDRASLVAMGDQANATFAAMLASGLPMAQALKAMAPGIQALQDEYQKLGMDIRLTGIAALAMQETILKSNPELIAGIDGLSSSLTTMAELGIANATSFADMEQAGAAMYTRLQAAAAAAGGTTADALLPMQEWLHKAADEAEKLGVPLDDNTQRMIDQSKELGIWQEEGKSATDTLVDGMTSLVDKFTEFITLLQNMPHPTAPWDGWSPPPSGAGSGSSDTSGGAAPGLSTGGYVGPGGIEYFGSGGRVGFLPMGTDTYPAMLSPGEMILTPEQQQQAFSGGGGGPIEITLINTLDGREMSRSVTRIQTRELQIRRKLGAA